MKRPLLVLLKIAVIAVCFRVILTRVNLHDVAERLAGASVPLMLASLVTVLLEPVVLAAKWNLLLRKKQINIPIARLVRIVFTSNFLSLLVPVSVGADALRILMLKGEQQSGTHSAGSLVADRVLGIIALVGTAAVGTALTWSSLPDRRVLVSVAIVAALVLAMVVVLVSPLPGLFLRLVRRRLRDGSLPARIAGRVEEVHDSLVSFRSMPGTLAPVLLLNVVIQILRTVGIVFLFHAVGRPVPLIQALAFVPMIVMLSLLPISYFGLGVKEGGFLYFFGQAGVPGPDCLTVSFITYVLIFAAMLPGAAFTLGPGGLAFGRRAAGGTAGGQPPPGESTP